MKKLFIGVDNGATGSIGIIGEEKDGVYFLQTPKTFGQDYTKKKGNISRINSVELRSLLEIAIMPYKNDEIILAIERPMINPTRFKNSISAARAFEITLAIVEELNIPHRFIDSKEWQKELLTKGVKGSTELKKNSLVIGNRLFPQFKENKHKDRDGILIAEYLRKTYTNK